MDRLDRLFGKRTATPRASDAGRNEAPVERMLPVPSTKTPMSANETLQETSDVLEKREAHVRRLLDTEIEAARVHQAAGRKREALDCIKRKRLHDKELERISQQKMSLLTTSHTLQQLRVASVVVEAEKTAAAAIEREMKKIGGPSGMDELKDKLDDLLADSADVLDASARPIGETADMDDADLLEELEEMEHAAEQKALEQELVDVTDGQQRVHVQQTMVAAQPVPAFDPRVARRAAKAQEEREAEERELAQLASKMHVEQPMPMPMAAAAC